jgi:hypothetical protein
MKKYSKTIEKLDIAPLLQNTVDSERINKDFTDPTYGTVNDDAKTINRIKNTADRYHHRSSKDSLSNEKLTHMLLGSYVGAPIGGMAGYGLAKLFKAKKDIAIPSGILAGLAGGAYGGYLGNNAYKKKIEDYNNLSDKDKIKMIKNYIKNIKNKDRNSFNDAAEFQRTDTLSALGGLASIATIPLAYSAMRLGAKTIKPLEDDLLHELIDNAGLKDKLITIKPKFDDNSFFGANAYFAEKKDLSPFYRSDKNYENAIGGISATHSDFWKPSIMAHEIGHGNIHADPGIVGKLQRKFYHPTTIANRVGLGIIPAMLTSAAVGKDDDSMLSGAGKGALISSLLNAGMLVPEFEASRRGLKFMLNSSMSKKDAYMSALKTLVPAFSTYFLGATAPSILTGAALAKINQKRKRKEERDEKKKSRTAEMLKNNKTS